MTGTNPPHDRDEPAQGGQPNETVQWWSTPPANTGAPVTGTDPTVLGGGQQGPVTGTDPTMLGAGFDNYVGTPQPPYPQQGQPYQQNPQGQPYQQSPPYQQGPPQQSQPYQQAPPQQAPPYQQPGYPPQPPYTNPPYGPQYPGRPYPPKKKKSNAGWIIGGVVGVVIVLAVAVGVVVVIAAKGSDSGGGSSDGGSGGGAGGDGNYAMSDVTDACSLIDTTVPSKWSPVPDGAPEHTETQPTDYSGGSLECKSSYTGAGKYGDDDSDIDFEADFQSDYSGPEFNSWRDYDTQTSGTGRTSGQITGLGQDGYYASTEDSYSSFVTLEYTCAVLDSNLSAKVTLSIDSATPTDKQQVDTACQDQLRKALTALHN